MVSDEKRDALRPGAYESGGTIKVERGFVDTKIAEQVEPLPCHSGSEILVASFSVRPEYFWVMASAPGRPFNERRITGVDASHTKRDFLAGDEHARQ